jgi:hypothetical protein
MALTAARPVAPRPDLPPAGDLEALDAQARIMLNDLRFVALECRAAARTDLFEACALLSGNAAVARSAHAAAFLRCLPEAIGRAPRLLRPGVAEVSFDEAWILRLLTSAAAGDGDSFAFLLRSRVEPWARRNFAFLVQSMAERFYRI